MSLPRSLRVVTLLLAAASLGACTLTAIPRPMPIVPAPDATPAEPEAGMAGAEEACTAAGRERGLELFGVASARD